MIGTDNLFSGKNISDVTGSGRAGNPVLVALDMIDPEKARDMATLLAPRVGGVKLGKEFFTANGPEGVRLVADAGAPVFLDLKFHDIPNTVAGAIRASLPLQPLMVNVHATGGAAMMRAAVAAADEAEKGGVRRPVVLAVTVLTSLNGEDLEATGQTGPVTDQVCRLASLAQKCGMDGVVCSSLEIEALRAECGPDFKLVVPGIRPEWAASQDQKRIMTPSQALELGADWLVIGRPITGAEDPFEAAGKICEEIGVSFSESGPDNGQSE